MFSASWRRHSNAAYLRRTEQTVHDLVYHISEGVKETGEESTNVARRYLITNKLDALGAARDYIQWWQTGQVGGQAASETQAQPGPIPTILVTTTAIVAPMDHDSDYWHHSALVEMGSNDEVSRQRADTMRSLIDSGVKDGVATQASIGTRTVGGTQPLVTAQPVLATQAAIAAQAAVSTPPMAEIQDGAGTQNPEGQAEWNVLDIRHDTYGEDPINKMYVG
ncbi:hypothetical protein EG328_007117 [Venturia inaequalis]|uniref:Uncharacterized protein n=1 Tax=Venturia inaequalis TaxID=5025 RepID=A0A8H3UG88_VENIN|nr:hypothetical protein EG328_007117 [Venturia inaequalis]